MPVVSTDLRGFLEKSVIAARDVSEDAARAALIALAVNRPEPFPSMDADQRRLRNALRAKVRQHGGGESGSTALVEEVAYEQWHRMLFARFLAENGLLMHPSGVAVTLEECRELAPEEGEGDEWQLAARYASQMLPGIFRADDPAVQLRFAPEGQRRLERTLADLPLAVFTADDSLGWVYQFWQTKKKEEVNRSGRKIGGEDLPPVTQLFTEDYMVRFLLENSLGAWWAARHPDSRLVKDYAYLRFREDGTPVAGTFPGWPDRAAAVTVMDPCCGSGHFLVAAFEMLRRMRMEEESLDEANAAEAVIRDNLYGLELDPRCTQIAAFAVAFAAWKAGGYRQLPLPNIACSGIPVAGQLDEWKKLAGDDVNLRMALERLYQLFRDAPTLGSLINPADAPLKDRLFAPDFAQVSPLLEKALRRERSTGDPTAAVFGSAAEGTAKAVRLLSTTYCLVTTNVPYVGQNKQDSVLKRFCESQYPDAKADLATVFVERCSAFAADSGTIAVVTPQNWLFLTSYRAMRMRLLKEKSWHCVVKLGEGGFESNAAAGAFASLIILGNHVPSANSTLAGLDVSAPRLPKEKASLLSTAEVSLTRQSELLALPDARVAFGSMHTGAVLLSAYADSYWGIGTGDTQRFIRQLWEVVLGDDWAFLQGTFTSTQPYAGRDQVIYWQEGNGDLVQLADALGNRPTRGHFAWGKPGIIISQMRGLNAALYTGEIFQHGACGYRSKGPA
jgi:hypothetical protein